jgi:flagellar basal body rod protein FlgB
MNRNQKLEAIMNKKMILLAIVMLALVSLACSININLPSTNIKTGPEVTDTIYVPVPKNAGTTSDVAINFGAGNITLKPGAEDALVDGTATYNVSDFKPIVTTQNDNVSIKQGDFNFEGLPSFKQDITNNWNLSLGNYPMSLVIKAGAYKGEYELGGLSIERLEIGDGAAKVDLSFSAPNLVQMSSLEYTTGASEVTLKGLANANTTDFTFRSGAGNYTLDFSGELQNDMEVNIESGVSSVTVIIPRGTNAQVITDSGLMTVSTDGSWNQSGDTYQVTGSGNTITLHVKMGAGNLKLESGNP